MSYTPDTEATENVVPTNVEPIEVAPKEPVEKPKAEAPNNNKRIKATRSAASKDPNLAGSYCTVVHINMRDGAGMSEKIMTIIPKNTKVRNYGFYTEVNGDKWLYVQVVMNNIVYSGFCSSKYLKKI